MIINGEELNRLLKLSMLTVQDSEREQTLAELNEAVELLSRLGGACLESEKLERNMLYDELREDEFSDSTNRAELLSAAPNADENSFLVKRVVE